MRLFLKFCDVTWQNTFAYRLENLLWFLIETVPILIMTSLWKSLELSGRLSHDQASELILYYILSLVIARLAATHFEEWFAEDIKDGKINSSLLKPFPIKSYLFAHSIINRFNGALYTLPIFIILFPLYGPVLIEKFSFLKLVLFVTLIFISFLQKFFFSWIISVAAFWFEQTYFLSHAKWIFEGILGGAWLPLTFFPLWWQNIAKFTPFYYWFFFPIQVFTSKLSPTEIISGTTMSFVWLLALIYLGHVAWQHGIRRHGAVSG